MAKGDKQPVRPRCPKCSMPHGSRMSDEEGAKWWCQACGHTWPRAVPPSESEAQLVTVATPKPAKPGFVLVPCPGDAHSNPYIDHCLTCAPRWGWVEVPEGVTTLEEHRERLYQQECDAKGIPKGER